MRRVLLGPCKDLAAHRMIFPGATISCPPVRSESGSGESQVTRGRDGDTGGGADAVCRQAPRPRLEPCELHQLPTSAPKLPGFSRPTSRSHPRGSKQEFGEVGVERLHVGTLFRGSPESTTSTRSVSFAPLPPRIDCSHNWLVLSSPSSSPEPPSILKTPRAYSVGPIDDDESSVDMSVDESSDEDLFLPEGARSEHDDAPRVAVVHRI